MLEIINDVVNILLIYLIITLFWQIAEYKVYGKIATRGLDDIVAVILGVSLYFNFN